MYSDGKSDVLKNVSFHVKPGQAVALLGSTGSGKTSLVNLLPRFHEYTGGRILLDGVELKDYSRSFLRKQIGIVEQEPFLFSRTIRENIAYGVGRDVSQEEIDRAAKAAAVHDVIVGFPDGYDTVVGEKGVTLSGGQKQRVAIARALINDPLIVMGDEPTGNLDKKNSDMVFDIFNSIVQEKKQTMLIVTHDPDFARRTHRIIEMADGKIISETKTSEQGRS